MDEDTDCPHISEAAENLKLDVEQIRATLNNRSCNGEIPCIMLSRDYDITVINKYFNAMWWWRLDNYYHDYYYCNKVLTITIIVICIVITSIEVKLGLDN